MCSEKLKVRNRVSDYVWGRNNFQINLKISVFDNMYVVFVGGGAWPKLSTMNLEDNSSPSEVVYVRVKVKEKELIYNFNINCKQKHKSRVPSALS